MLHLTSADISVVVQGAIGPQTERTLDSVRQHLPDAEIILSTWEGSVIKASSANINLQSSDPGPSGLIRRFPFPQTNNVNRQIISSRAGVNASTRRYCLRMRTDMEVTSSHFLKLYNHFYEVGPQGITKQRIMAEALTTSLHAPFAIGDWWLFGLRDDLRALYDIPLYDPQLHDGLEFFEQPENEHKRPFLAEACCRYPPEHYIASTFVSKHKRVRFRHVYDANANAVMSSRDFILQSLLTVEPALSGLRLPKAANIDAPGSYATGLCFKKWHQEAFTKGLIKADINSVVDTSNSDRMTQAFHKHPEFELKQLEIAITQNYTRESPAILHIEPDGNEVRDCEVTFIVAGKISPNTDDSVASLRSVRTHFPKAKVVIATWEGTDISLCDGLYDDFVLCKLANEVPDIFAFDMAIRKPNSISLQQTLMAAGLARTTTRYAVRFRPDFVFNSNALISFYSYWKTTLSSRRKEYVLFSDRILTLRVFTNNPRHLDGHLVHHPCDSFQLGRTSDLRLLWTGEPMPKEVATYFDDNLDSKYPNPQNFNHLFTAEQFSWLRLLRRSLPNIIQPRYYDDNRPDTMTFETEALFSSNFIIASQDQLGLSSKFSDRVYRSPQFYFFSDFLDTYLRFTNPHDRVVLDHYWFGFHMRTLTNRRHQLSPASVRRSLELLNHMEKIVDVEKLARWQMPDVRMNCYMAMKAHPAQFHAKLAFRYFRTFLIHFGIRLGVLAHHVLPLTVRRAIRWMSHRLIMALSVLRDRIV